MKRLIYVNFYLRIFCLIANTLRGVAFKIWLHLSTGSLSISGKCIVLYSIGHAFFHFGSVARSVKKEEETQQRVNKERRLYWSCLGCIAVFFFFFNIYFLHYATWAKHIQVPGGCSRPSSALIGAVLSKASSFIIYILKLLSNVFRVHSIYLN